MSYPEDHDILDAIMDALPASTIRRLRVTRESESIEFTDPEDDRKLEIVVRAIDEDEDDEGDEF